MREGEFTPSDMAAFLTRMKFADGELASAAAAARALGRPDAAERLADEMERMIDEAEAGGDRPVRAQDGAGDRHMAQEEVQE